MQNGSDNMGDWCVIREAAAHLRLSESFVRKLVRERQIPFVRVGAKVLRFRRQELDRWLESQSTRPEALL